MAVGSELCFDPPRPAHAPEMQPPAPAAQPNEAALDQLLPHGEYPDMPDYVKGRDPPPPAEENRGGGVFRGVLIFYFSVRSI